MSPLLFVIALDPIIKELDNHIQSIKINNQTYINKLVYMDDLKVYINKKEDAEKIDNKIIRLYSSIGMKINEKKSGITIHNNMNVNKSLLDKYPEVTKQDKYKYLGLKIFEINENI